MPASPRWDGIVYPQGKTPADVAAWVGERVRPPGDRALATLRKVKFLKALVIHNDEPSWNLVVGEETGGKHRFAEIIETIAGEEYAFAFATFADHEDPLAWFARVKDDPMFAISEQSAMMLDYETDPDILKATFGTRQ